MGTATPPHLLAASITLLISMDLQLPFLRRPKDPSRRAESTVRIQQSHLHNKTVKSCLTYVLFRRVDSSCMVVKYACGARWVDSFLQNPNPPSPKAQIEKKRRSDENAAFNFLNAELDAICGRQKRTRIQTLELGKPTSRNFSAC
jgi:hypothetical protein